jgi:hypothetical protein
MVVMAAERGGRREEKGERRKEKGEEQAGLKRGPGYLAGGLVP